MWVPMAKKGKEIDLGGFSVQVDPLILLRRVLMREKLLLVAIAILGGILTVLAYVKSPKEYESFGAISIRTEGMQENYVRQLSNSAMRKLHSKNELMLIINELNLFPSTRATLPYEIALKTLDKQLEIDPNTGRVGVSYMSKSPEQAQAVAAFVCERALWHYGRQLDAPFRRQLDALDRGIHDLEPQLKAGRDRLFEFRAKHPGVAIQTPAYMRQGSPLAGVAADIAREERNLRRCYAGVRAKPKKKRAATLGPACRALEALKRERAALMGRLTASHPDVLRMDERVRKQAPACAREAGSTQETEGGIQPGMNQQQCVALARGRLAKLHRDRVDIQKKAIKKPQLQSEWAELTLQVGQLESELRALQERRARVSRERRTAAYEFEENFKLVDPPRVPGLAAKPVRTRFMLIGMLITAIIGLLIAVVREATRQTFADAQELADETGLTVLAKLPKLS